MIQTVFKLANGFGPIEKKRRFPFFRPVHESIFGHLVLKFGHVQSFHGLSMVFLVGTQLKLLQKYDLELKICVSIEKKSFIVFQALDVTNYVQMT